MHLLAPFVFFLLLSYIVLRITFLINLPYQITYAKVHFCNCGQTNVVDISLLIKNVVWYSHTYTCVNTLKVHINKLTCEENHPIGVSSGADHLIHGKLASKILPLQLFTHNNTNLPTATQESKCTTSCLLTYN